MARWPSRFVAPREILDRIRATHETRLCEWSKWQTCSDTTLAASPETFARGSDNRSLHQVSRLTFYVERFFARSACMRRAESDDVPEMSWRFVEWS
jgi:hypothetical protein